jgi:quercetin dioxygenase-like cupin family protein
MLDVNSLALQENIMKLIAILDNGSQLIECDEGFIIPDHSHPAWESIVVLFGCCIVNDRNYNSQRNFCAIHPNEIHNFRALTVVRIAVKHTA